MKVIEFFSSDRKEHWLEKISKNDWKAGALLFDIIVNDTFFDRLGEGAKLLLLVEGDELVSFCTYAKYDDVRAEELTPWMGFVYTFPEYRGHHYIKKLFAEIERLAKEEGVKEFYISTGYTGLYEKYGCEFKTILDDIHGKPTRVYVKKVI